LFLDTEFAEPAGVNLVSLALVSEDGQHEFYVERDPLPANPSDFVRESVYPLLERGSAALPDLELTTRLRAFLSQFPSPHILADHPSDLRLLRNAIDGFAMPASQTRWSGLMPHYESTQMDRGDGLGAMVEFWFQADPERGARRHHALVDANALRWAWQVLTRRVEQPAWVYRSSY